MIKEHNSTAAIVTTPWEELDGKTLLEAMEQRDTLEAELERLASEEEICPVCGHHHDEDEHHHDHDEHHHHHDHDDEHHHHDHDEHHHHHDHEDEHHHDHDEHHHHDHDEHHHHHDHDGHHHHHHADDVFASWGTETAKRFGKEEIETALRELGNEDKYGIILRAKGIVCGDDGSWIHFDYVPGEPDVRTGSAAVTGRLCVIGSKINENAVKELFGLNEER